MTLIRLREIRKMTPEQRRKKLLEYKALLLEYKGHQSTGGSVENPGLMKEIRRAIARIHTVMKEYGELP